MPNSDNSLLKNVAYLYIAFAHLTDSDLSDEEQNEIERLVTAFDPSIDTAAVEFTLQAAYHWYNTTAEGRLPVVHNIAAAIHTESESTKSKILSDLVSIAKADKKLDPREVDFINILSGAWGVSVDF